jgi:hypothetical protein
MKKEHRKILAKIRRKLSKVVDLHSYACGRDEDLNKAFQAEDDLMNLIKEELEKPSESREG